MTTGRSNKLVGATGEYLVAAELSRRGLIATTFTGNVPHYDIVASDETGRHVSVQVKASRGPSWQFGNISLYCDITFDRLHGRHESDPVGRSFRAEASRGMSEVPSMPPTSPSLMPMRAPAAPISRVWRSWW